MPEDKKSADRSKRNQERMLKVISGAAEMEIWLKDLLRSGILQLPQQNNEWFDKIRSRMTDAQATGLGNMVRELKELPYRKTDEWQSESAHIIAKLFLLVEGIRRLDELDAVTQADVRYLSGWSVNQKEILEDVNVTNISDQWLHIARMTELIEDITVQRNYLYGLRSGAFALQINFAFRYAPINSALFPGGVFEMDLAFVPSNMPLRAVIRKMGDEKSYLPEAIAMLPNFTALLAEMTRFRSKYPWADEYPFALTGISALQIDNAFFLKDKEGNCLSISDKFELMQCLHLLACTGGHPHDIFVLFSGGKIIPLGIIGKRRYVLL